MHELIGKFSTKIAFGFVFVMSIQSLSAWSQTAFPGSTVLWSRDAISICEPELGRGT